MLTKSPAFGPGPFACRWLHSSSSRRDSGAHPSVGSRRRRAGSARLRRPQRRVAPGRFLGPKADLTPGDLAYLNDVDGHDHEALVCVDSESGQPLGIARFIRLGDDPEVAEAAVAVVDEAQGRGIGTALMNALAERAQEEGIRRFRTVLLADNAKSANLLEQLGSVRRGHVESGVVEMEVDLPVGRESAAERARVLRAAATGTVWVGVRLPGGFSLLFGWTFGDAERGRSQASRLTSGRAPRTDDPGGR